MSSALEISDKKGGDGLFQAIQPVFSPKAEDVGVVVLPGPAGAEGVMAKSRPYTGELIGGNRHSYAGAAYQDSPVELAASHNFPDFFSDVRIVHGFRGISAQVLTVMSGRGRYFDDLQFEVNSSVVAANGDSHKSGFLLRSCLFLAFLRGYILDKAPLRASRWLYSPYLLHLQSQRYTLYSDQRFRVDQAC